MFKLRKCKHPFHLSLLVSFDVIQYNGRGLSLLLITILAETEHVSLAHLQLAQSMKDEVRKLEEFRERQRETRKRVSTFISAMIYSGISILLTCVTFLPQIEQHMDALHKLKASQFKKTIDVSRNFKMDKYFNV